MIQVPVQDCRQAQLVDLMELEAQRPAGEVEMGRDLHQRFQRGTLEGDRMATAQVAEIHMVAVVGSYHGEAGEAALGGLGLVNDGQAATPAEVGEQACHQETLALSRGSSSQVSSDRRSRMMSARSSMSAWSGIRSP